MQKWFENLLPDAIMGRSEKKPELEPRQESFSLLELMDSSFSFTQDRLTNLMIEVYKPDKLIEIPRNSSGMFDFDQAKKILEIGKKAYQKGMHSTGE
jgi:NTE family protein